VLARIRADIMHFQTQPMRRLVRIKLFERSFVAALIVLQESQLHETIEEDLARSFVNAVDRESGRDSGNGCVVRGQHYIIQLALLRIEFAGYRHSARNVTAIHLVTRAGIEQQQIAIPELSAVVYVMQYGSVATGGSYGWEGGTAGAA
jgi:hypothetical protein